MGEGVKSLRVCLARRRSGKAGRARWIGHRTEWMESRKVVAAGNCYGTAAPARQRKGFRSLILKRGRGGGSNRPGREGGGAAWTGVKGWSVPCVRSVDRCCRGEGSPLLFLTVLRIAPSAFKVSLWVL
jgi:hypothetical protein